MSTDNPFDDDISVLSGDGNWDEIAVRPQERQLPQQEPGTSLSSLESNRPSNNDVGGTAERRRLSEQSRPTQERGRSLSTMRPGSSLASLPPTKSGGGGTAASASAAAPAPMTRSGSSGRQRSRLKLRLPHLSSGEDVSVTDSICSGVIREFANAKALAKTTRSKIESKIADFDNKFTNNGGGDDGVGVVSATKTVTVEAVAWPHVDSSNASAARSHVNNSFVAPPADRPAVRGEVPDVLSIIACDRSKTKDTNISSVLTNSSRGGCHEDIHDDIMRDIVGDDTHNNLVDGDEARLRREQRKERVRERLERYREDIGRLRAICVGLESALATTSQKLREVDSTAAKRIQALESELRKAREEGEATRTNQEACIKELGKKLIRQAHVIKKKRNDVEQLKMELEAMAEEMAMQDERDSRRDEEVRRLEDLLEKSRDSQAQMQAELQGAIEEVVGLKFELERDAKNIMELEFDLGQKVAMLNRVARDLAEKTERICELEQGLEDKTFEVKTVTKELDEIKESSEVMRQQFEAAAKEIEDMKCKFSGWGSTKTDVETVGNAAANTQSPHSWRRSSVAKGDVINKIDKPPLLAEDDDNENDMKKAFASELQAKDATIRILNDACKEKDETINALRSDMVKISSTYREDSYLKRKEIAKLKQQNAEFALKLRALEKAFAAVNATENMTAVSTKDDTKFLAHSSHGGGGSGGGGGVRAASLHGESVHPEFHSSKAGMAAAVSVRLGELKLLRDSKEVQQANFFDDDAASDRGSSLGGKGEDPEEQ